MCLSCTFYASRSGWPIQILLLCCCCYRHTMICCGRMKQSWHSLEFQSKSLALSHLTLLWEVSYWVRAQLGWSQHHHRLTVCFVWTYSLKHFLSPDETVTVVCLPPVSMVVPVLLFTHWLLCITQILCALYKFRIVRCNVSRCILKCKLSAISCIELSLSFS